LPNRYNKCTIATLTAAQGCERICPPSETGGRITIILTHKLFDAKDMVYCIETGMTAPFVRGFLRLGGERLETRVAVIAIIVEEPDSVERLNSILHQYSTHIVGRFGIPYRQRGISIISVAVDAPQDVISAMSGTIGRLKGVTAKAVYSK